MNHPGRLAAAYPARVTIGLLLIVLSTFISGVQLLRTAFPVRAKADEVTAYETRLQKLKEALPRRGTVGFVSELPKQPDARLDRAYYLKHFFLTQYSLAPVVVVANTEPALVVGISHPAPSASRPSAPELTLLHDFGDGVMLFATTSR